MRLLRLCLLTLAIATVGAGFAAAQDAAPELSLLSAYFGLDNALPANRLCIPSRGLDGMPVIMSEEIDQASLQPSDFSVITAAGVASTPRCATLSPAIDVGELRTVLLIGEFGNADTDPPARVEVVGDIFAAESGLGSFLGASVEVTPLSAGPSIIVAESVPTSQWSLGREGDRQAGSGCPNIGTIQIVRVTWAGGVSNSAGDEAGEPERALYRVTLRQADGSTLEVTPFALADLGDGDNNHLLCLDRRGEPLEVSFPGGYLVDPNEDALNPEARASVRALANETGSAGLNTRNVRYCEVLLTYRSLLTLQTVVWNTLGLNDCPDDAWKALDGPALQEEADALAITLNGPRYWVLDEIASLGGVTSSGNLATFGGIEMQERAVLEMPITAARAERSPYEGTTVDRTTRYIFYSGELIYTLTSADGTMYVMQSYSQIVDPELTIDDLATLGDRLALPEGWAYEAILLGADLALFSNGETTVIQDDLQNTYQRLGQSVIVRAQ